MQDAILATACVPWGKQGTFLEDVFRRQVRQLLAVGFRNLYIFGTAGEGYAVTDALFVEVAEAFQQETRGQAGVRQLGVIGLSTSQVRRRIELGLEMGFVQFQISLPCWGRLTDSEVDRYFADVLQPYPQASFLHYNTSRSGRVLTGAEYGRLQAAHSNLTATKSGGHSVASLLSLFHSASGIQHFVTELDYAAACLLGLNAGLLVSISAANPSRSLEFFLAGRHGNNNRLREMVGQLNKIREQVIALVSQAGGHMDGAFDKVFARLLDAEFPLTLLSPYQDAGDAVFDQFVQWLKNELPAWH